MRLRISLRRKSHCKLKNPGFDTVGTSQETAFTEKKSYEERRNEMLRLGDWDDEVEYEDLEGDEETITREPTYDAQVQPTLFAPRMSTTLLRQHVLTL